MSKAADYIYEQLSKDMVSHGFFVQSVAQENHSESEWQAVLSELLSRDVEIGVAQSASSNYVEFIAWKGKLEERISRAAKRVETLRATDREFAYWLALRKNVDHFESERNR